MRGRPPARGHAQLRRDIKAARQAGKSLRKYLNDKKDKNNGKNMDIN